MFPAITPVCYPCGKMIALSRENDSSLTSGSLTGKCATQGTVRTVRVTVRPLSGKILGKVERRRKYSVVGAKTELLVGAFSISCANKLSDSDELDQTGW